MSDARHRTVSHKGPHHPGTAAEAKVPARHLRQSDLARRWSVSEQTLANWRWKRVGPPFLKVGNRVLYRYEDVEGFEAANLVAVGASKPDLDRAAGAQARQLYTAIARTGKGLEASRGRTRG